MSVENPPSNPEAAGRASERGHGGPGHRPVRWRPALALFALLPLGWLLLGLAALRPDWTESAYSRGLFPVLRGGLGVLVGWVPFSVAEVLLAAAVLLVGARVATGLRRWRRGERALADLARHAAAQGLGAAGVVYAAFLLLWGFNYARQPFAVQAGLETGPTSVEELLALGEELVLRCNELRDEVADDDLELRGRRDPRLEAGFAAAARSYPTLSGDLPPLRRALLSPLMTRLGITGIYFPFTCEPHVNREIPLPSRPFTACHELAHSRGIAREDEASFVGHLACRLSGDAAFEYSGSYVALEHVIGALGRGGHLRAAQALSSACSPEVAMDRLREQAFWATRRSIVTDVGRLANDLYLKSQGEAEGVASYGRMVDLLLAERRARGRR